MKKGVAQADDGPRGVENGQECAQPPPVTYEAPRDPCHTIRVRGVGRVADEPRALLLALTERPTDDEIRALHDFFSQRSLLDAIAKAEGVEAGPPSEASTPNPLSPRHPDREAGGTS